MRPLAASAVPLPPALATGFRAVAGRPPLAAETAAPPEAPRPADGSSGLSPREVASLLVAFEPVMTATGGGIDPRFVEEIVSQVAALRAAGEDTVLVVISTPGGGAAVSAMSAGRFAGALEQGGDSMGRVAGPGGRTDPVADHVRAAFAHLGDAGGAPPGSAVADVLAGGFATGRPIRGAGLQPGATVELLPLPARPGATPPRGGSGLVNFVV
jgi:hypothetical protein